MDDFAVLEATTLSAESTTWCGHLRRRSARQISPLRRVICPPYALRPPDVAPIGVADCRVADLIPDYGKQPAHDSELVGRLKSSRPTPARNLVAQCACWLTIKSFIDGELSVLALFGVARPHDCLVATGPPLFLNLCASREPRSPAFIFVGINLPN